MKGTVKWYNARKGYGFITPDDKSDDVFVHATSLKECGLKKLFTGSEVSFEISEDDKGKRLFADGDKATLRREVEASILQEIQLAMLESGSDKEVEEVEKDLKSE